jgi:hypothetical protein
VLLAAPGLGSLIAIAILLTARPSHRPGRLVVLSIFIYCLLLTASAISRNYAVSFVVLAAAGLLETLVVVTRASSMHEVAPLETLGRVAGSVLALGRGLNQVSQAQYGLLAGVVGGPGAVALAGAALGVAAFTATNGNVAIATFNCGASCAFARQDSDHGLASAAINDSVDPT